MSGIISFKEGYLLYIIKCLTIFIKTINCLINVLYFKNPI